MFYLFTSFVGTSVISLTVSYLLQVYSGLRQRNAFGLNLHLSTAETGDAAEVIAGIGPQGQFEAGYSDLSDLGTTIGAVKESHHFYPILFYFRFREPYYSVSRAALVSLDTATLIKSALDEDAYGWFMQSGAVGHLWRASLLLVTTLEETFLPGGGPSSKPHQIQQRGSAGDAGILPPYDAFEQRASKRSRTSMPASSATSNYVAVGISISHCLRHRWLTRWTTLIL